jgi:2-oxoglutarate ferredoxin oxidoreductase subunit delta
LGKVIVKEEECKGCGLCVNACPKKVLKLSEQKLNIRGYHPVEVIQAELCIGCASCARMCPDVVLEVEK